MFGNNAILLIILSIKLPFINIHSDKGLQSETSVF